MRKIMSLALALALIMSLSITAYADETGVEAGSYNTDVTGTYVEGTTSSGTVFSVDIAWSGMNFTYNAEKAPVWNTENHTYSESIPAYWEGEGTIKVTNHSNAKISAIPVYKSEAGYEDAKMTFSADKLSVASAESGSEQLGTITVTPSGTLPSSANGTKIGTITVTIAQDNDVTVEETDALASKLLNSSYRSKWEENGATDNEISAATGLANAYFTEKSSATMNGEQMTQDEINYHYNLMNSKFNEMEAKYGG